MVTIRVATINDFDNIYSLYNKESRAVGPVMPFAIRERISLSECIVAEDDGKFVGVCNFHLLKKQERSTVYEIAVCEEARIKGVAKALVHHVLELYKRPVTAKCIKGSTAEKFWSSIGKYVSEEESRKQKVCVYQVGKEVQLRKGLLDNLV